MSKRPQTGVAGVAAMIDDARAIVDIDPETGEELPPPAVNADNTDVSLPGDWVNGMPPDCPFLVLGRNKGVNHFANSDGQLISYSDAQLNNAGNLMGLMDGNSDFAETYFIGEKKKMDAGKARDAIMRATKKMGVFNPENKVRGRGGWRGDNGELVVHFGDEIWIEKLPNDGDDPDPEPHSGFQNDICLPGMLQGYFYEADERLTRPWDKPVAADELLPLLEKIQSWNWVRSYTAPRLFLGALAQAIIGGAFDWRSHVIVQGSSGAGKSTLMNMAEMTLGGAAIKVEDASEAGLSSTLRNQTLPVIFDEFEGEEDERHALAVIKLMRRASSGGTRVRGSQTHESHSSTNKSAFFASMITLPSMRPQDLNRMLLLQVRDLETKSGWRPEEKEFKVLGRKLLRRMLDGWSAYPERRAIYGQRLAELGHSSRGQDTIGNLLACADIALGYENPPDADLIAKWTQGLAPEQMLEFEGQGSDFDQVIREIMQAQPRGWHPDIRVASVGTLLARLYDKRFNQMDDLAFIKKGMEFAGLSLCQRRGDNPGWDLFIPNNHKVTRELFAGGKFYGLSGVKGKWIYALSLGPPEYVKDNATGTVDGTKQRGTKVALEHVIDQAKGDAPD